MGFFFCRNVDVISFLRRIVSLLLLGFMASSNFFSGSRIGAEAQMLPVAEVETLQVVFRKMQLTGMNVTRTSCNDGAFQQATVDNSGSQLNITCNCTYNSSTVCHVTNMRVRGLDMAGELPSELQNLTYLEVIDLSRNYLNGSIPPSLSRLPLTNLSLIGNRLSGPIPPEMGDIATLRELLLDTNNLGGPLPQSLGNLSRLNRLSLAANNFTGTIPETFGNLKNLTDFRIDGNTLSGRIPEFIGNWTRLDRLDLQGTSMEGPIPSAISLLKNLTQLRISDLRGPSSSFPDLEDMKNMRYLILRNCLIRDTIRDYIGDMSVLDTLDLSFNQLSGQVPQSLQSLQSMRFMFLTNNSLSGVVPNWIQTSSYNFDLSYNNFTEAPRYTCQQARINLVSSYSSIEGNSGAWCLSKDLQCERSARYHSLFINCGGEAVEVDGNEYNQDTISEGASTFASTATWAYSSTGVYVGNDRGQFIATSPSTMNTTLPELYRTARLAPQSLKYYGLCMRPGNYRVVLHFAEITFSNDQTFRSLGRRIFDVAIQGKVLLEDFNIMEQAGGAGIEITRPFDVDVNGSTLEIHLYWKGKGTTNIPTLGFHGPLISAITVTPNFKVGTGGGLSTGAIAGIVVSSCVVIAVLLAALRMKGYIGRRDLENAELRGLDLQTGYFTLRQIKTATGNFNPANKIGEGGFGPVYKGVLSDGVVIAVKQLSSKSKQGNREFVNEIGMISALQHPNLVRLYGCCIEGNQLLLVYEYLENNCLGRALFGPEEHRLNLDWNTRKKICLGIARGLAYLHEESRLKIVHRDIKATNVLLDKSLNAKISDFGLAKLDEEENTHISTRIAGTVGYMAPEYAMRGYLTDKADVYSFGVVILEIVSGKSNTSYRPREEFVYLLDWAYVLQEQGNLLELVDPALGSQYKTGEALTLLNLALLCTNPSPTLRPSMSSVVSMIEGKTAVQPPIIKRNSSNQDPRFKAFESLAHDSQTHVSGSAFSDMSQDQRSMSTDGPWVDSSRSVHEESRERSSSIRILQEP